MMMRNDGIRNIALLICVLVTPVRTTVLEQDSAIEFLLRKVAELEKSQQECSIYQKGMLLELNYVKNKLQQSERRISELEAVVYNNRSDDYTENLGVANEDDPVDRPASENVITAVTEEKYFSRISEFKGMQSHKRGILRRNGRGIATKQIGFCATMVNSIGNLHVNEIVHFDTVLHDESNGFNKQTGFFTCPLSGTYFFTVSLMADQGHTADVQLIVNGQTKGRSYADGGNSYDQGSISTIVRCEAGQNVWISVYGGTVIVGYYYTSFSGFLLWGDGSS